MQWLPSDSYFTKSLTFSKNIPADEVCLGDSYGPFVILFLKEKV